MSEKLVLIDGHSILNRAFFGIPDLTNSEGLHTNAVYGFLNILSKSSLFIMHLIRFQTVYLAYSAPCTVR